MGVIADLFSCGRSRRTRDLSTEPHLTNGATPPAPAPAPELELALEHAAHETAAFQDKATTDSVNHDIRTPISGRVQPAQRQPAERGRSISRDGAKLDLALHHEKGKLSGGGWMLEQRVLVTTTTPSRNVTPAPEVETAETVSPPLVRCPTPEEEPWNAIVRRATPEPQAETSDASMLVRCATPEEEPWNTSVRHATPEPDKPASIRCATPEPHPQQTSLPVDEVAPVSVSDQVRPVSPEPQVEVVQVQAIKKTAPPVGLLDMPPGMLPACYSACARANVTQRSATASTSV